MQRPDADSVLLHRRRAGLKLEENDDGVQREVVPEVPPILVEQSRFSGLGRAIKELSERDEARCDEKVALRPSHDAFLRDERGNEGQEQLRPAKDRADAVFRRRCVNDEERKHSGSNADLG